MKGFPRACGWPFRLPSIVLVMTAIVAVTGCEFFDGPSSAISVGFAFPRQAGGATVPSGIARILLTVEGEDFSALVRELTPETTSMSLTLPSGPSRKISAVAFGSDGTELYRGETVFDLLPGESKTVGVAFLPIVIGVQNPDIAISLAAISGVTAPAVGGVPVSSITEADQYTGTVTWSPNDAAFAVGTVYTATITVTPKQGYTATGVASNFFTVAGATATNPADSGVVTAVFPATRSGNFVHIDADTQAAGALGVWGDGTFIYVADFDGSAGALHSYSVDGSGNLTWIDSDPAVGDFIPFGVWGDGNFIYVADSAGQFDNPSIHSYSVDGSGNLTRIDSDGPALGAAKGVWGDGNFVYLATGAGGIRSYSVDGSGNLTFIDSDIQTGSSVEAWGVWGDGTFLYVAYNLGGIHSYSVDTSGNLTHLDSDWQGGSVTGVWGDGRFIYVAAGSNGLQTYSVDGSGNLTWIDLDYREGSGPTGVWGDGTFIYASSDVEGIHSYTVDGSGNLTWIDTDDLSAEENVSGADVWGDGTFIYLANFAGGISSYRVE